MREVSDILTQILNRDLHSLNKSSISQLHPCLQEPNALQTRLTDQVALPVPVKAGGGGGARGQSEPYLKKYVTLSSQSEHPVPLDIVIGSEGST